MCENIEVEDGVSLVDHQQAGDNVPHPLHLNMNHSQLRLR